MLLGDAANCLREDGEIFHFQAERADGIHAMAVEACA